MSFIYKFIQKPIFSNKRFIFCIWMIIPLIAGLKHALRSVNNNYLIFKHTFYNTIDQVNLYAEYAEKYFDTNHYGPVFGFFMTPFALLPDGVGTLLWELVIAASLFVAIYKLPMVWKAKVIIYWLSLHCLYMNAVNSQTNTLIAALLIGSFICMRSDKVFWAACFIALGLFIKLYGVVGLAFFFFSKNKIKFSASFLFWCIVFFILPMLISSPEFIIQSYIDWYDSLVVKNISNSNSLMQNISAIGMIKKITGWYDVSNTIFLGISLALFALQYIQIKYYSNLTYQIGILASTLLFVVLFSTGSESCTYIIATIGAGLWFMLQKRPVNKYVTVLMILVLFFSIVAASDIAPPYLKKEIVRPYALKALPYLIVWFTLVYQLITFKKSKDKTMTETYLIDNDTPNEKV